jgi:hypothetical protein
LDKNRKNLRKKSEKRRNHNPRVGGSSPSSATNLINALSLLLAVPARARQALGYQLG